MTRVTILALGLVLCAGVAQGEAPAPTAARAGFEQAGRALVADWLAAQNTNNFEAYVALYAARFTGVKRSGDRTYQFDRVGWLKDRKRMFSPKVSVEATDVAVRGVAGSMIIQFTQRWASGKYEDVGTKRIIAVKEGDRWRIGREEMLTSKVEHDTTRAVEVPLAAMVPIVSGAVLLANEVPDAWADTSALTKVTVTNGIHRTTAGVTDAVPADLEAWVGRKVRVFNDKGLVCRTTVKELRVAAPFVPHFGAVQTWQEDPPDDLAVVVWNAAPEGHRLIGVLETQCDRALWAQADDQPQPQVWAWNEDKAASKLVDAKFRALPGFKAIQNAYKKEFGKKEGGTQNLWDEEGQDTEARVFTGPDDRQLATTLGTAGMCGEFTGEFQAMWLVKGASKRGGQWTLLTDKKSTSGELIILAAATLVEGQMPVLLARDRFSLGLRVLRHDGKTYQVLRAYDIPYYDCPC